MYGETVLERQAREQADADAERAITTLRDAQIGSLPEITVKGNPTVFYILTAAILTGLLFPLGSKRRSLWLLAMLVPSLVAAQSVTPFEQKVVSGADTFIVYGKSTTSYVTTTNTTTAVDSIVKVKPTPPPIVLGKPFGPTALYAETKKAPFTASGGESSNKPQWLLDNIVRARALKIPMIASLPCGSHNTARLGNCLRDSSGVAVFSRFRFDSAMATYNTPQIRAAVDSAYKEGWLLAVNLMDEPWVKGGGDGNTWGPNGLTRAQADTSCRTAKAGAFANVPVGTSDAPPTTWPTNGYVFKWCDVGIPQFSYRRGSPASWRDTMLVQVAKGQYGLIFSFNVVNGGTQDKTLPWDCAAQGGIKGTREPNCTMTASQITTAVANLGGAGCGAQIMWRADSARFAKLGVTVFNDAVATQATRPKNPCKVR